MLPTLAPASFYCHGGRAVYAAGPACGRRAGVNELCRPHLAWLWVRGGCQVVACLHAFMHART
eukprot:177381-Chlamydomonas_euryale.AAC.4